jgi:hypothetical protein
MGSATVHINGANSAIGAINPNEKITIAWWDNAGTKTLVDVWAYRKYQLPTAPAN